MTGIQRSYVVSLLSMMVVVWTAYPTQSQSDTSYMLPVAEISALRIQISDVGKHTEVLDSATVRNAYYPNLALLLATQSPLFVRHYGAGSLATLGIRGGSSSHTQVQWNGIPIRNPMLGLIDLSLVSTDMFDKASVHYGGHGAAFGSGAMGGILSLENITLKQPNSIRIHGALGSWANIHAGLGAIYGSKKWRFGTRVSMNSARNDFLYRLNSQSPSRRQEHNAFKRYSLLQEASLFMKNNAFLTARLWYEYADRQLPPTSVQSVSQAGQQDTYLRMMLQYEKQNDVFSYGFKAAWLDEQIAYQDTQILLFTENQFKTFLSEASFVYRFSPKLRFTGGAQAEFSSASSAGYKGEIETRNQYSLYSTASYITRNWVARIQLREELTGNLFSPLLWDAGIDIKLLKNVDLKSSVSRHYRLPGLNDLYWKPGGNVDLQPENGHAFETGIYLHGQSPKSGWKLNLVGYYRKTNNWIMWVPPTTPERNYWAPQNVASIHSRGVESRLETNISIADINLKLHSGLDLTWSTYAEDVPSLRYQAGDQILYIPVENLVVGLTVRQKQFSVFYQHYFFGQSPGINETVESANLGAAGMNFNIDNKRSRADIFWQIDNLWNTSYRIVERRPMPGRSFQIGLRMTLLGNTPIFDK